MKNMKNMKNKVLAVAISASMFFSMAVPVFAEGSQQSGAANNVKILEFAKNSYTVGNGTELDLSRELSAYASTKQLVLDPSIEWTLETNTNFAFNISGNGIVTAQEDSGNATVVAKASDGTTKATVKVSASRTSSTIATGFTFEDNSYVLQTGADATLLGTTQTINIVPNPRNTSFTTSQLDAIESALNSAVANRRFDISGSNVTVTPSVVRGTNRVGVVYPNGSGSDVVETQYLYAINGTANNNTRASIGGKNIDIPSGTSSTEAAALIAQAFTSSDKWDGSGTTDNNYALVLTSNNGYRKADPGNLTFPSGSGLSTSGRKTIPASIGNNSAVLGAISEASISSKSFSFEVSSFPNPNGSNAGRIAKNVSVSGKAATGISGINATASTLNVKVGERVSMTSKFKVSPSTTRTESSQLYFEREYADQSAQYSDYAVFTDNPEDPSEIIGVAVGKNRINATITTSSGETKTASIVINVIEKGAPGSSSSPSSDSTSSDTTDTTTKPKLSFTEGNTSIGGTGFTITVSEIPIGSSVTFKSLNPAIATVDANGKVSPMAAGQTKIEITVSGIAEKLYCTVNVKSASTPGGTGGGSGATDVPKTGISVLGLLF